MNASFFNSAAAVIEFLRTADPKVPIEALQDAFAAAGEPSARAGKWRLAVDNYKRFDEVFGKVADGAAAADDGADYPAVQTFGLGGRITITWENGEQHQMALATTACAARELDLLADTMMVALGCGENSGRADLLKAQALIGKAKAMVANARREITNEIFALETK